MNMNAFKTGKYTNLFLECGYSESEINARIKKIWDTMFFGSDDERIYHEIGDMGYIVDTGNLDVRTEGMSYGMMMSVQLDKKEVFDRLWKWTKTYMWMDRGDNKGYFAWSVSLDGVKNSYGPAPDGEEYFAMALFFASARWGDGEGIFNYSREARDILHECVHKGEDGRGFPMWNPQNKLIKFIPNCEFSDPSYHLPHFYELFSLLANEKDRAFWKEAAKASREYLKKACHTVTGLAAEYAEYDGTPRMQEGHGFFYSDAYRVAANIGLDWEWFGADEWECDCAGKIQDFFAAKTGGEENFIFKVDGTKIEEKVLHPVGLLAANAQTSLASNSIHKMDFVKRLWETPLRSGERRYYDNCLYLFAFLALSGNYRIYI